MLFAAAQLVAPHCDAVELNCGCPQRCAKQGGYGAFLMEQPELLESLVHALVRDTASSTTNTTCSSEDHSSNGSSSPSSSSSSNSHSSSDSSGSVHSGVRRPDGTRLPVFVKVRVFDDVAATVALCLRIQAAGADALTVHGRTRHQVKNWLNVTLLIAPPPPTAVFFSLKFLLFLKIIEKWGGQREELKLQNILGETKTHIVMLASNLNPLPCIPIIHREVVGTKAATALIGQPLRQ